MYSLHYTHTTLHYTHTTLHTLLGLNSGPQGHNHYTTQPPHTHTHTHTHKKVLAKINIATENVIFVDLEYDRAIEEEGYYKDILHKINRNLRRQFEDHYRLKYLIDVGIKFVFETETCTIHINLLLSPFWDSKWELFSSLVIVQQHKRWK